MRDIGETTCIWEKREKLIINLSFLWEVKSVKNLAPFRDLWLEEEKLSWLEKCAKFTPLTSFTIIFAKDSLRIFDYVRVSVCVRYKMKNV